MAIPFSAIGVSERLGQFPHEESSTDASIDASSRTVISANLEGKVLLSDSATLAPSRSSEVDDEIGRIGRVLFLSTTNNDTGCDWAICDLEPSILAKLQQSRNLNSIPRSSSRDEPEIIARRIAYGSLINHEAYVVTASKHVVRGVVPGTPSYYKADGEKRFVKVLTLRLEHSLGQSPMKDASIYQNLANVFKDWEIVVPGWWMLTDDG